jgi:hypothetical protein
MLISPRQRVGTPIRRMPPPAIRSAAHGRFRAPLRLEFCSPGRHRVRTFENLLALADPDVGRPLGHARGRTQIIGFGVASGGRLGNKVAEITAEMYATSGWKI